jgi:hypothetical protein
MLDFVSLVGMAPLAIVWTSSSPSALPCQGRVLWATSTLLLDGSLVILRLQCVVCSRLLRLRVLLVLIQLQFVIRLCLFNSMHPLLS